jgi:hypothetical protein
VDASTPSVVLTQKILNRSYKWSDIQKSQLRARLASDATTRHDAYALRYKSYVTGGHINPSPTSLFSDNHDDDPNSRTVVVYAGYEAIGSARVSLMDVIDGSSISKPVPAHFVFPEEIDGIMRQVPEADRPKRAVEITRLVRHPNFIEDQGLILLLLRLVGYVITELDADVVLSCVRRNHVPFYKRLGLRRIAGPKLYPSLNFDTYLLARSRADFGDVRRVVPVFDMNAAAKSSYAGLLDGRDVRVSVDAAA